MRHRAALVVAGAALVQGTAAAQAGLAIDGYLWPPRDEVHAAASGARPEFAGAVAMLGDVVLVGAPRAVVRGAGSGAVHVALRTTDGGDWIRLPGAALDAGLLGTGARFGAAISAQGGLAAIGAPGADGPGGSMSGVVRLFAIERTTGRSQFLAELAPPAGSVGASFGASLALDVTPGAARRLAVGAPLAGAATGSVPLAGAVFVFVESVTGWRLDLALRAPVPAVAAGFGSSVAFVGGALAIGVPGDGSVAPGAGRVFGFDRSGSVSWEIGPAGSSAGARYGSPLCAVDGQTLAVGVFGRGAVEVVTVSAGAVRHQGLLRGDVLGGFGVAIAGSGCDVFVGAPFAGVDRRGAVRRFVRDGGTWHPAGTLDPSPATAGGEFGVALAMDTGQDGVLRVVVGEPASDQSCPPVAGHCGAGRATVVEVVRRCRGH